MKKVIISTQSGGMPTILNKENCIVVKKNASFLKNIESFDKKELQQIANKAHDDAKNYSNKVILEMQKLFQLDFH